MPSITHSRRMMRNQLFMRKSIRLLKVPLPFKENNISLKCDEANKKKVNDS